MQSLNKISLYQYNNPDTCPELIAAHQPFNNQIVKGFDEIKKKWIVVQYRHDSNVFFQYPYTGALYPKDRMHQWKKIKNLHENT